MEENKERKIKWSDDWKKENRIEKKEKKSEIEKSIIDLEMKVERKGWRIEKYVERKGNLEEKMRNWFEGLNRIEIGKILGKRIDKIGGFEKKKRKMRRGFRRKEKIVKRIERGWKRELKIGIVERRIEDKSKKMEGGKEINDI